MVVAACVDNIYFHVVRAPFQRGLVSRKLLSSWRAYSLILQFHNFARRLIRNSESLERLSVKIFPFAIVTKCGILLPMKNFAFQLGLIG
jgi:hypothetical protein